MVTSFSHIFCWKLYLAADHNKIVFIVHKSWFARISITQRSFFIYSHTYLVPRFLTSGTEAVHTAQTVTKSQGLLLLLNDRVLTAGAPHYVPHAIQSLLQSFIWIYLFISNTNVGSYSYFFLYLPNWKQEIVAYMFMIVYVYKNLWLNHQYFNKIMTFKNGLLIMAY